MSRVRRVTPIKESRSVYDLTVDHYHNFAITGDSGEGSIVHNSKVFNKPMEEIVDAERRFSKTINQIWSSINGVNCWNSLRAVRATA